MNPHAIISTIKDLPPSERPREKLLLRGPGALTDAELLAILLASGTRHENALLLAQRMIKHYSLDGLARRQHKTLRKLNGIGDAKACKLLASFELAKRIRTKRVRKQKSILTAKDIYHRYGPHLSPLPQEHVVMVLLDTRQRIIHEKTIFIGTLNASTIHPRDLFAYAVEEHAAAYILLHNHPSGDPAPSQEDATITKTLREAGELIGMPLIDHIIIGRGRFYSFHEEEQW